MTRMSKVHLTILVVFGLLYLSTTVNALVVGIDLGSDSFKVVLVRPGSIDIVLNEGSGRKTISAVGYSQHGRLFGEQVQQLYTKNPLLVFNAMTQAIGRGAKSIDDSWITNLQQGDHHLYWLKNATITTEHLPSLDGEPELKRLMVQLGDQIVFTEEILAQLLSKARQYATAEAGASVKDCVITVPYYWTHTQRQALLDAANLAGFNVLSLLNQNMAIALKFMTDRDFDQGPTHVVFYDMGTSDLQVSLYRFESTKGKGKTKWVNNATLLATASDNTLGGSSFDSAIVDLWIKKLKAEFGDDFILPPQAVTKLQKQAKKTKEILSANKEAYSAVESLILDYDFRTSITREEFERATEALVKRAIAPLKTVLKAANMVPTQLDYFEMFGGGARIPKIQDALKAFLNPVQLSRHLNTDEAAAFGAAIYAASKSSQHRVKEFHARDGSNAHYPILVRATDEAGKPLVTGEDASTQQASGSQASSSNSGSDAQEDALDKVLYKESSRLGSRRTLKIKTDKDIFVELKYPSTVKLEDGLSRLIARYKISLPKDLYTRYNVTDTPTAHIRFELTTSGTVLLTSADAQVPIVTRRVVSIKSDPVTPNESKSKDLKEDVDSNANNNDETDLDESSDKADTSSTEDADSESSTDNSTASNENDEAKNNAQDTASTEEKTEIREIFSTVNVKLVLETLASVGLNPTQIADARRRLKVLDDEERVRLETERAKSDLEALIYSIYDKLEEEETVKYSTSEEREALSTSCGTDAEWLEYDGADALKSDYLDRKNELSKMWNKIMLRISEAKELPVAVEKCQELIEASRELLVKIEETRNVTTADIEPVTEAINKVEEFIVNALKTETEKLPHEDPKTLSGQVTTKCREFGWRLEFLSKRPKKSKPVEAKQNTTNTTQSNNSAEKQADQSSHDTTSNAAAPESTSESGSETQREEL